MTDHSTQNIAVFGLGSMGYGMAQSLLRAGHQVHGFDLLPEAMARFQAEGGAPGTLADIAPHLDAVVAVVLNGRANRQASCLGIRGWLLRARMSKPPVMPSKNLKTRHGLHC